MEIILTSQDFFYFKGSDNGQEVLADITEQKSPSTPTGTGTASPQVEASPKSSSRKRSVKFGKCAISRIFFYLQKNN